jgi:hypothetical protein|uniref:Uncharacterized protein n=1 Tax=viral metagenome TaxID=1070528 RepID=A0A6C0BRP5_9ZZZZ
MPHILGGYMPHGENFNTEYKEFCIKSNIYKYLSSNQVKQIVRNGKLPRKMNHIIMLNICKYFEMYIPKYASSFHNSCHSQETNNMRFTIGVNDYSEITGVPYVGEDITEQKRYLNSSLQHILKKNVTNICCLSVELEIIECEIYDELIEDTSLTKALKVQDMQEIWYNKRLRKYNKKRKKWIKCVLKYKGKLQEVLDDPICKEELRCYLKEQNKLDEYASYVDQYYEIDVGKIKDDKKDVSSFVYWLIKYKDDKVQELMRTKPVAPIYPRINNVEYSASTTLSCLRKRLLESTPNLRYYILVIRMIKNPDCSQNIKYCDPKKKWRNIKRCLHEDNSPYSIDI